MAPASDTASDAEDDLTISAETVIDMLVGEAPLEAAGIQFLLGALACATDEVLGFLSGRIECHTTQGGDIEPWLAALRSQARSREEKAAVALLAARAAEGAGDAAAARDLLDEALTLRPGLEPALHDAAQYAAARGDYVTADRYLRRAQLPSSLRAGLSEAIAASTAVRDVGRNNPCPCGSGRKFKACCQRTALPALSARAQLVYALVGTYAERAPNRKIIMSLLERTEDPEQYAMFVLDLALFPGGLAEKFLATRGHWLRPEERQLIEDWRDIPVALYEVLDVVWDTGITLRALPDGDPIQLSDKLFSQHTHRLELFCGRLLHDGTDPCLLALPVRVPRHRRRELISLLAAGPSVERIVEFFAAEPPAQVRNSDGEDVYDCGVTYQVPDPQLAFEQLVQRLSQTDDDVIDWQRCLPDGRVVSLGQIRRDGAEFTVTANSLSRLGGLEAKLREVAPDAVERDRHAERSSPDPEGHPGRTVVLENYVLQASSPAEADEAAEGLSRGTETSWLDTPGVIGELSPREAVASADPAVLTELRSTLDDVEATLRQAQRAGNPTAGLMSPQRLREALGLYDHY